MELVHQLLQPPRSSRAPLRPERDAILVAEVTAFFRIVALIFLLLLRTLPSTDKSSLRIDIMRHILCQMIDDPLGEYLDVLGCACPVRAPDLHAKEAASRLFL